jgi:hypothetical protein
MYYNKAKNKLFFGKKLFYNNKEMALENAFIEDFEN